jgi:ABC-type transport system involved in cytochrome bd biosynthesis fused ATPase/permease subunit
MDAPYLSDDAFAKPRRLALRARANPNILEHRRPGPMAVQYSFVMKGLTKTFPGAPKPVLNNIHLQFLPGTKIAIIGVNGAGKSTLMKIMAGYDTEYQGEAWAAEGIRVVYQAHVPRFELYQPD